MTIYPQKKDFWKILKFSQNSIFMPRDPFQSIPGVKMYMKNGVKNQVGEFFFITFFKFVKDQKCSFSSKTDVFWRDMTKWWVQWEYSEKMLSYEVLDTSVRLIFGMFMTVSGSKKKCCAPVLKKNMIPVLKKSSFKKNLPVSFLKTSRIQI